MDKQTITLDRPGFNQYDHALSMGDTTFHVRSAISRKEKENAAAEMVARALLTDDDLGICHVALNADVGHLIVALRHYTDLDIDEYDSDDGIYALFDMFTAAGVYESFFAVIDTDWRAVGQIYHNLMDIAASNFVRQHSLAYRATEFLEDFLAVGDLTQTAAQAHEINNMLVEAFDAVRANRKVSEKIGGNILSFAKKEPATK